MQSIRPFPVLCSLLVVAAAAQSFAQTIARPIYTTFDAATNSVPSPLGGTRTFSSFTSLSRSPSGERWTVIGNFSGDTTTGRAIFTGSGGAGALLVQRGQPIPGITTRTFSVLDNPRINDAGQFVFSSNSSGTPAAPVVFFLKGALTPSPSYSYVAAVGEPITTLPGLSYSGGFSSTLLDNSGRHGMQCSVNDGSSTAPAIIFNGQLLSKANDPAFGPTLADGTLGIWTNFTLRRVFVDAQGNPFFWGIGPSGEDIASTGTNALVSEGFPLASGGPNVQTFNSVWLEPSGRWFVRGTLDDNADAAARTDFVYSNGALLAKRSDPVTPGSSITWDRTTSTSTLNGFLFNVADNAGNVVIGGIGLENGVRGGIAVLNGTTVVARAGDPIDLNGDGIVNEDAVIAGFKQEIGPGTAFLAPGGDLYLLVTARTGAGTSLGEALIRKQIQLPSPACRVDFDGSNSATVDDIFIYLNLWFAGCTGSPAAPCNGRSADFDTTPGLSIDDLFIYLNAWFQGC